MMIDSKEFVAGFLQYLQSYYGGASGRAPATEHANLPKLPLFQDTTDRVEFPGEMMGQGMEQGLSMEPDGMAQQLNGLFPGPYDRMN